MARMFRQPFQSRDRAGARSPLKWVILLTVGLSLFAALFDVLFPKAGLPSPYHLFSLSHWGITHGFVWQLLSNFFLLPSVGGINFSFLISLLFTSYMIWVVGNAVTELKSVRGFMWLYIGGGVIASLIGCAVLLGGGYPHLLAGTTPALYALMMGWLMLCPDVQILLFFAIPVRVKWLIVGIIGIHLFVDLSHGLLLNSLMLFGAVSFAYLYCVISWKTNSPFLFLRKFENWLLRVLAPRRKKARYTDAKIYDIRDSLTMKERLRLWLASRRTKGRS